MTGPPTDVLPVQRRPEPDRREPTGTTPVEAGPATDVLPVQRRPATADRPDPGAATGTAPPGSSAPDSATTSDDSTATGTTATADTKTADTRTADTKTADTKTADTPHPGAQARATTADRPYGQAVHPVPPPDRRSRTAVIVVAVVAAVLAALLIPFLLNRGDDDPAQSAPTTAPSAAPTTAAPTTTPGEALATPSPPPAAAPPAGFKLYRNPAGWAIAVPADWRAERSGRAVTFTDPKQPRSLRVTVRTDPPEDPYDDALRLERVVKPATPGYDLVRIARVKFRGWPTADWEYTTAAKARVLVRTVVPDDTQLYTLTYTSTPQRWRGDRPTFDAALRTFSPAA